MSDEHQPPEEQRSPEPVAGPPAPEGPRAEPDKPKTALLFLAVIVSAFVLVGVVLGVDQYFQLSVQKEIDAKVLSADNPALRQLRADEAARLTRYQWADQAKAVVRIPVERARDLVLAEWAARPSGFVRGASEPAAPAPKK